jgi:2'-5' RNA ligase
MPTPTADRRPEGATLRAFVALDLDATGRRRVMRLSDRLRMASGAPSAAWVAANKMHVTLKFVADLPEAAVAPLGKAIGAMVQGRPAPPACALRLDAFPSTAKARVVVVELVDEGGALAKLAARVDKLVAKYDVPLETRAFRPHVTLARLKIVYDARRWLRPELAEAVGTCGLAAITLYRSRLGSEGATYVPLATFAFGGAS